jgi:hypothetical protein
VHIPVPGTVFYTSRFLKLGTRANDLSASMGRKQKKYGFVKILEKHVFVTLSDVSGI